MRVVSGMARGRKLKSLSGNTIMPTTDMVKESIFNIIQFDIEGRSVLDLFAGTGQLGIEALSRGAKSVVFVDSNPEAQMLIRENTELCGFMDSAAIVRRDALRYLEGSEKFDLIFIDPPYATALAAKVLSKINEFDKLNVNGIIICELSAEKEPPAVTLPYFLQKEYRYGRVKIARYTRGRKDL